MPLDGYLLYRLSVILLRGTQFKELKLNLLSVDISNVQCNYINDHN